MSNTAGRFKSLVGLAALLIPPVLPALQTASASHTFPSASAVFIENVGQFDSRVLFQAKIGGQVAWLTRTGIVFDTTRPTANPENDTASTASVLSHSPKTDAGATNTHRTERLAFSEDFVDTTCCSSVSGRRPTAGVINYYQGDSANWHTNVPVYSEVLYREVWPGIDVRVYSNGPDLEQDFIVHPRADPNRIAVAYRGIDKLALAQDGSLEINTAFGKFRETRPRIYQDVAGQRAEVTGRFRLQTDTEYSFEVESYDPDYGLVIDPTLLYSTFLGGAAGGFNGGLYYGGEFATGIAVDTAGNAYVAGNTQSMDFPTTTGSLQPSPAGGSFIAKLNPNGSSLVYSTYFGRSTKINGIAVDSTGRAYITGTTSDAYYGYAFPTTANAYRRTCASLDYYLTALTPDGTGLAYSTCFNVSGASEGYGYYPRAIAVDNNGRAFITGGAPTYLPTTATAYQSVNPGNRGASFLTVFNTAASGEASLLYSTYFGLPGVSPQFHYGTLAYGIAVDTNGAAYVTGQTGEGLPVTPGAYQTTFNFGALCNPAASAMVPCPIAFVAKFNPFASGSSSLVFSTYLGPRDGGLTAGTAIAVDLSGNTYLTGYTKPSASLSFPVTPGAFETTPLYCYPCMFATKVSADGSRLAYSTYLSGKSESYGAGITVNSRGQAYVAGYVRYGGGSDSYYPTTANAFQRSFSKTSGGSYIAVLTELSADGTTLIYSTYLTGSGDDQAFGVAIDQTGDAYVSGFTTSPNFPVTSGAYQTSMRGPGDAFITKFPLGDVFRVLGLSLNHGGNSGQVSTIVFGSGFREGATARLIGPQTVTSIKATVGAAGTYLYATFDLTGSPPGIYSVAVTNPDGATQTLPNSFTVEQGGAADVVVSVIGRNVMRGGQTQTYFVTATNQGNIDSALVRLWLAFPNYIQWKASTQVPSSTGQLNGTSYVAFDVAKVSAGSSSSIPIQLTAPDNPIYAHQTFQVQVWKEGNR